MIKTIKGTLIALNLDNDKEIAFEVISVNGLRFEIVSEEELDMEVVYKLYLSFNIVTHECIFRVVSDKGSNRYMIDLIAPNSLMINELKNIG